MKYAIIKVINSNYFVHAEGITDLASSKATFHGLCQALWNAPDVITATVAIVDENLNVVSDAYENPVNPSTYREYISHPVVDESEE